MPQLTPKQRIILIGLVVITILVLPLIFSRFNDIKKWFSGKQTATPSPTMQPLVYQCPAAKSFCVNGHDITKDGRYLGFGGNLASKSAVLAAFDGNATFTETILPPELKSEKLVTVYLDNPEHKVRAIYYFKGDATTSREVTKGELLGLSLSKINAYNTSLLFQIIKGDPATGQKVNINNEDFKF